MTTDAKEIALQYLNACGSKNFDAVAPLLATDVKFVGPGNALTGAAPYLAVLRRIGAVWLRSDVKRVFVDGHDVCAIYDFVTDTAAGAVPIVEWLRIEAGKITSVTLVFDRVAFKPASDEIARRAAPNEP
jgi:hypothetical protein